jgi:hypothetical protein
MLYVHCTNFWTQNRFPSIRTCQILLSLINRISDVKRKCDNISSGGLNVTIQMAGDLRIMHWMKAVYLEQSPKLIPRLQSTILVFTNNLHTKINKHKSNSIKIGNTWQFESAELLKLIRTMLKIEIVASNLSFFASSTWYVHFSGLTRLK